jgi:hypothetical protein
MIIETGDNTIILTNNDYNNCSTNRAHYEESQLASRLLLINDLCSKTRSQI